VDVLVIGGNRFMGRLAAWRLLAGGHRVTLLNRGNLPDPFGARVERLRGDRTRDLERLVAGRRFDGVLDFAAFTGEDGRRAVEAFRGRVGHYVMVSTGQVYLVRDACPRPARESDYDGALLPRPAGPPDLPEWEYGVGKREAEDAIASARGFPATRLRIPMVNGEADPFRRIESYLWRLADGEPVLVPDGGTHLVRHVHAGEVARLAVGILGRTEATGEAFNVAQEETPTLCDLLAALRDLLGSSSALVDAPLDALRGEGLEPKAISPFSGRWMSFLDPGRTRARLGFRHAPLAEGLASIVAAFLARGPDAPPEGLRTRAAEVRLAQRLGR
jgi:nucleoside-diphosphate-sugar epimerase